MYDQPPIKAKSVSKLHLSPILVCKCRFIVRKQSKETLLCRLAALLAQLFNLYRGHVLQSGIARESLKVSPMPDRTAAAAAMILFLSRGRKRPTGKKRRRRDDRPDVIRRPPGRGRCCVTRRTGSERANVASASFSAFYHDVELLSYKCIGPLERSATKKYFAIEM